MGHVDTEYHISVHGIPVEGDWSLTSLTYVREAIWDTHADSRVTRVQLT